MTLKQILLAAALTAFAFSSPASAHDLWSTAEKPEAGQPLTAVIGYGHNFPEWENIPDDEIGLFKPVRVIGPEGDLTMKPGKTNYQAVSTEALAKGTYLVIADVQPVFWTKTPKGWSQKPRNEEPQATACGLYIENAKGLVNVGGDTATAVISKPVGLPLEIIPLANPAAVKPGQRLQMKVLFQGRPLAGAKVEARSAGFAKEALAGAQAFSDTTDHEGLVNFVPLADGDWIVTVRNVRPFPETEKCDTEDFGTSLFFTIPK